jgi:replicative DNA helicase
VSDEQVLPHNLDAEKAVLGAILIDNERLVDACAVIGDARFYRDAHRRIFRAMVTLADRRAQIDLVTLKDELTRAGDLEEVGGPAYISALMDGVPRSSSIEGYARIVEEKAALRDLIHAGRRLTADAYAADRAATEILESAERAILGLSSGSRAAGFESMAAIAPRAMNALEAAHATKHGISGVATGFADLDAITRGLQPGTLVVLGARPGMGKTSLAMNIGSHAALVGGLAVGIFSVEMPSEELFIRNIAAHARLDSHSLQGGYLGARAWSSVAEAVSAIADSRMFVDQTPGITVFEVRSRARRLKAEHGLDLLIIDYLQLMGSAGRHDNRNLEIGAITTALKGLAKELKIPVLLLSQLSREPEKRGTRPKLSDLRDSGSIEQDADIVAFLYRPEEADDTSVTDLIIAKHRNGQIGTVKLAWFERQTRFDNHSEYEQPVDQRLPMGDRS